MARLRGAVRASSPCALQASQLLWPGSKRMCSDSTLDRERAGQGGRWHWVPGQDRSGIVGTRLEHSAVAVKCPELALQWDSECNQPWTPWDVSYRSHKKFWWICPENPSHRWKASVASRTVKVNSGKAVYRCPFCSNRRVLPESSLLCTCYLDPIAIPTSDVLPNADKRPDIAAEWHSTRNGKLKPVDVSVGSCRRVWWRCAHVCSKFYSSRTHSSAHVIP